jgi:hypothetical protein
MLIRRARADARIGRRRVERSDEFISRRLR